MSLFYCKCRPFNVQLCILSSFTCMCLATIDQFLATCSNRRWHRWNNLKVARHILIGASIVWILHGIHFIIYYNHTLSSERNYTLTIGIFVYFQASFYIYVCVSKRFCQQLIYVHLLFISIDGVVQE